MLVSVAGRQRVEAYMCHGRMASRFKERVFRGADENRDLVQSLLITKFIDRRSNSHSVGELPASTISKSAYAMLLDLELKGLGSWAGGGFGQVLS